MKSTLRLPDYTIGPVLWQTTGRIVYRAHNLVDDAVCSLETIDAQYPERNLVAALRREAYITQELSAIPGIRKIHNVLPHGSGNLVLVTDLYESTLQQVLAQSGGHGLPLAQVLEISLSLINILGRMHQKNIVHKALSSQHVLINTVNGDIALAGLAFASELDQELQSTQLPKQSEETLPYMSPEQTGRMNRDVDYRSDYYSLGILIFELLTGERPFEAKDALDWVYTHICRLPPSPNTLVPQLPEVISNIVLKLLAKCPEERYQNSESLKYDLTHCADYLALGKTIESFVLGEQGVVQKFLVPQKLYGREKELQHLVNLFEQAVNGQTRFCLVHGYSGVGKSVLVNEIDRFQVRERGFLVQSKFDQFQQGEAYSALAATYSALVQQLLQLPEQQLEQWRWNLQTALSPNASLVLELVPELELIIGKQPPVPQLPPAEARNRQHLVLAAFLQVLAGKGHPVVLFLDDLHWSDAPTLELLRRIVTSREQTHLLLIAAYRSNEVVPGHPLSTLLETLKNQNNIDYLPVEPLDKEAVSELVADSLCCDKDEPYALTELLYNKAKGNPFFTNELLRYLHKQGAISTNTKSGYWHWNIDRVNWADVSDDSVSFMLDNLRELSKETQQVLQLAACIGACFDLQTLAAIYQHSVADTAAALLPALKQYTIQPLHSDYRLVSGYKDALDFELSYRFQHDKVQQAAYQLIDVKQLPQVHLSIGRLLLLQIDGDVPSECLSDIVGHLNQGIEFIDSPKERLDLAELNLRAGQRAKNATAYKAALTYLLLVEQLLPENPWKETPELMKTLASEIQQCYYLTGFIEQAESWIELLLLHADSNVQRSDILATRTRQYATLGRMDESIVAAIQGLALLNIEFTDQPTLADIDVERKLVEENLAGRSIASLVDEPTVQDPAILIAMRLLMEIFPAAFLSGVGNLFPYLVIKSVNLSLRHGNCPESAFNYAAYGMLLCGELDEPALGYQYGKVGLAINERLDDLTLRSRVIYVYAMFVHHWSNHWTTLTPLFLKGIEAGYQSGDLLYLAYSAQDCVIWDPTLDIETAERLHSENMEIVRECAYQDSLDSGTLFLQLQRNLLGKTHAETSLSDSQFDSQKCFDGMQQRQFMTGIANHNIYNAEACFLYGDYDRALQFIHAQDPLIKSAMSLPQLTRYYLVANLTLTHHYPDMSLDEQPRVLARLYRDLARMTRWADNCEDNFRHLQYLMTAELERIKGHFDLALQHYNAAIEAAKKSGFLHDEATACERAACHLLAQGQKKSAEGYLRAAHRIYERWGAKAKVKWLLKEYPILQELTGQAFHSTKETDISNLDLASVMKASREISGEIVLDRLLQKTMSILLENSSAQWGCLVVRREDNFIVEAVKLPETGLPTVDVPEHMYLPTSNGSRLPLPIALINKIFFSGEALVLHEAALEGEFSRDPYIIAQRARSVLCVPIKRERFEGVLYLENNLTSGVFTEERVEIIRLLAAQASVAIENARLYEQVQEYSHTLEAKVVKRTARLEELNEELQNLADRDGLTNVANRRRGDAYLQEVWLRLRREEQPLTVIMLDVDYFKAYNDNYGHQAGDDCLKRIAAEVQSKLNRVGDLIARYGGEEFILILPNTDCHGAERLGEAVCSAVASLAIDHNFSSASDVVTISAGSATVVPVQNTTVTIEQLVHQADIALYKAKQQGRNQVQVTTEAVFSDNEMKSKVSSPR